MCRGKVSEGLDFADNNARAVITVRNRFVKTFKSSILFVLYTVMPLRNGHPGDRGKWSLDILAVGKRFRGRYTVIKRWPLVEGSSVVLMNMVFSRSVNTYAACVEMYGMSARWKSKS